MKIAYITNYIGKEFQNKYSKNKNFSVSATYKCRGIARALMLIGNEVTIFSSGNTMCNRKIKSFEEVEIYPEGKLTIKYPKIFSFRKFSLLNSLTLKKLIKKEYKKNNYDILIYYNITTDAFFSINIFKDKIKIIEYEDNIFNKALEGNKNNFVWFKNRIYNYLIKRTHGLMAVCIGMLNINIKHKILTPGIIDEEVLDNIIIGNQHIIKKNVPVKIILTGGVHYSKGPDLLIKAMQYIHHPCEVHFFSSTNFYQEALEALKTVPQKHKIIINDFLEHKKLIKYLTDNADILINTTRNMGVGEQNAGFPFKMIEYAAIGRPIVSSLIGKLDDEFNNYITYYNKDTPEDIARAINYVINHYEELFSKALDLQKLAIKRYSIEGVAKILKPFIEICVKNEYKNNN